MRRGRGVSALKQDREAILEIDREEAIKANRGLPTFLKISVCWRCETGTQASTSDRQAAGKEKWFDSQSFLTNGNYKIDKKKKCQTKRENRMLSDLFRDYFLSFIVL